LSGTVASAGANLWAISDLHVEHAVNREAVLSLPSFGDDWLLIAGDVAETGDDLKWALDELSVRFGRLFWTPGNHELWARHTDRTGRGVDRYDRLVRICREHGCVTPEDPFVVWDGHQGRLLVAPIFVLYDYSFRPPSVPLESCVEWAISANVLCTDEVLLDTHPFPNPVAWCHARVAETERRLTQALAGQSCGTILLSHFPLRWCDARLPSMPEFALWCGTRLTEDWPRRFRARVCISGHLHRRRSVVEHGCHFEEVSLGYPAQWRGHLGLGAYLRKIDVAAADALLALQSDFGTS
jgi:3',5'-cyclic AMP phosphodiesterase CpdA